jgi:ADP-ribose pyrophosphatase
MKIPKSADCKYHGIIFDVYQWKQRMYDGSYKTFEAVKRPDTVEVIAVQGKKILIARQMQPGRSWIYSLFGGRREKDETPLAAAKRELREESGLVGSEWQLFRKYQPYHKIDHTIYVFIARGCRRVCEPHLDSGEKIHVRAVTFREFISIVTSGKFWAMDLILDVFRMIQKKKLAEFEMLLLGGKL